MRKGNAKRPHQVGFIGGEGIGPEVAGASRRCADATGIQIQWDNISLGQEAFLRGGQPLPALMAKALLKNGCVLKAPLESAHGILSRNPNTMLNELFGIFASIRHCRGFEGAKTFWPGLDIMVIRQENWPDIGRFEADSRDPEWESMRKLGAPLHGAAAVRFVSAEGCRSFLESAMEYSANAGRRKVTVAHRINHSRKADGLWLEAAEEAARRFPGMEVEDMLTEHLVMQLVRSPQRFDVILVPEWEGDAIGNAAVSLAGGLGFVPETLLGTKGRIHTTVHGTAPKYADLDRANPCAMILAVAEMMEGLRELDAARLIVTSVRQALLAGSRTSDAAPGSGLEKWTGTMEFTDEVVRRVKAVGTARKLENDKKPVK